jgi:hypothetical protein
MDGQKCKRNGAPRIFNNRAVNTRNKNLLLTHLIMLHCCVLHVEASLGVYVKGKVVTSGKFFRSSGLTKSFRIILILEQAASLQLWTDGRQQMKQS